MSKESSLNNEPVSGISRRDLFRSAGKTVIGLFLLEISGNKLIHAQEIKAEDSLQSALEKLRIRVMTSDNEVAAVLRIDKSGNMTWDNFQQGTAYAVSQSQDSVDKFLEEARAKGDSVVYFHTHPISAITRQPDLSPVQKKLILERKTKALPSFPPSLPGLNMKGDYDRQMLNQFKQEGPLRIARPVKTAVADSRGVWILALDPSNPFVRDYYRIKNQMEYTFEGIKKDENLKLVKLNVIMQGSIQEVLLSYYENHLGNLENHNRSRLANVLGEWQAFIENNLEILNKANAASFAYYRQSVASEQANPQGIIDAFKAMGANLEFVPYDKVTIEKFK